MLKLAMFDKTIPVAYNKTPLTSAELKSLRSSYEMLWRRWYQPDRTFKKLEVVEELLQMHEENVLRLLDEVGRLQALVVEYRDRSGQ
jgi:hypothetical protein